MAMKADNRNEGTYKLGTEMREYGLRLIHVSLSLSLSLSLTACGCRRGEKGGPGGGG